VRLVALEGEHPEADALRQAFTERGLDEVLRPKRGPHPRLLARLTRPDGREVTLSSS
jgi:hypothetical protein